MGEPAVQTRRPQLSILLATLMSATVGDPELLINSIFGPVYYRMLNVDQEGEMHRRGTNG